MHILKKRPFYRTFRQLFDASTGRRIHLLLISLIMIGPMAVAAPASDLDGDSDSDGRDLFILSDRLLTDQATPQDVSDFAEVYGRTDLDANPYDAYYPPWHDAMPLEIISFDYDPNRSNTENGALLRSVIQGLTPGQRLEIGTGIYSINSWFTIDLRGSAEHPIWICAKPGETPVLTRPDANQNAVNIGASGGSRYLVLDSLEITGGDTLLKLYDCANLWVHRCHIHDGNGAGIAANSADTDHLYLTQNEIHDTGGTAEGMYLGANHSAHIMTNSIIAANHIHNCFGSQGDGIEIKQGSYGNWIVENVVHDTNYPCIIAYGTDGNGVNIIERNILYRSNDNTMQVQGEAIVRNNLIMAGTHAGFASTDHQGQTRNLTVVHNTIINTARATNLSSWNNRAGMVLANNAIYSRYAESIRFPNGSSGVSVSGNIVYGPVSGATGGYASGIGLSDDFEKVTWDAENRDATPVPGSSLIGSADAQYAVEEDIHGDERISELDSGAFDYR